ncbi:MAG TPA: redoxin domain-containing protein, partial [Pyrinomonadaceae bacterium]|nr:redoxin domain-containing protein [Pyrinomonadaceae bacterium]
MKVELQLPPFEGATDWLNREEANDLKRGTKGRPLLVHFWSLSSEPATTNLAQIGDLRDQRKREGLRVIAVHSPQSEAEKDPNAVRNAIARLNLTEPCALDNDHKLSDAFGEGRDVLPAYYLFDIDGNIRTAASGASALDQIDDDLDQMLHELRASRPFCPQCEVFLNKEAMFCAECGLPLTLPGSGSPHPYYENHYQ